MKKLPVSFAAMASLLLLAGNAHASVAAPEIDGSGAAIALGLVIGLVALIREHKQSR